MKTITRKFKIIARATCSHDFKRFAFYHTSRREVLRCSKCNKRKEIQH